MKKLLLLMALTAMFGISADAQKRGGQKLTPEQRVEKRMEQLDSKLKLSDEHRQILVLREMEGCCYETIAEILQLPVGTVRSRLFRARVVLKEVLSVEG